MKIENDYAIDALYEKYFEPYFQPIIDTESGSCVGIEILARLVRPVRATGNCFPDFLNGYTEQSKISRIMLKKVMVFLKSISLPYGFKISFNIPPNLLAEDWLSNICEDFLRACDYNIMLVLELTEHSPILINNDSIKIGLSRLNNVNILFALDDFGTGYSNIHLIKILPIDIIKIPKEFIEPLPDGKLEGAIIDSIINISRSSDIQLIAEGVESAEQSRWLANKGIHLQQGFYFSHPINLTDLNLYLNKTPFLSKKTNNAMVLEEKKSRNLKFPQSLLTQCTEKYKLSDHETEVLVLIAKGISVNSISELKHRSYKTIWAHKNNAYKKIGIKNDAEFINYLHLLASAI
ncbi:EAL domain-containing protein [Salmonella enterica]|uniref:EAL domain-containing protein n=1 Tax=Salmonella enterica TaxID=28901 RepID=UPI000BA069C6|nr:EAL domain-containing protein [Salmonella enterica]EBV7253170.1 EAL domain-containing protein [Salmonella enterica subsp. enterica serovar Pomona]EGA8870298.1 EAL domain-containing protein [Salmonella enterica subsp. enterica serovar Oranienburg]EHM1179208.1 EAL domain-containing protein [Salmonella enterica subsp. enterica serovar Urbana]EAW7736375.1 EAL domain-containing protein [Salmonella enterica]EEJ1803854.1 EAL domain-containing protein [Salmonella enterica subsp. enterica serovar Po